MEDDLIKFLELEYFGNRVEDYLYSLAAFIGIWIFLKIVQKLIFRKLDEKRYHRLATFKSHVAKIFSSVNSAIFPLLALAVAIKRLKIPSHLDNGINYVILGAVVLQVVVILCRLADYSVTRISFGKDSDDLSLKSARGNLAAIAKGVIWVAGFLFLLSNLGINITTFVTGLGIGGIAIALAAQSMLGDIFSSFVIAIDKPFEIGDSIVIDRFTGTVESIGLKTTRIRSLGGELIVVSNSDLTGTRIQNFKRMSTRRIVFKLGVNYETSDSLLAEIPTILKQIIEASGNTRFDRAHFLEFGEWSLNFEVVYFIASAEYSDYCDAQHKINLSVRTEFAKRGITMPFPTRTLFLEKNANPV
jgi:small-conductance mechanosensitive channel